MVDIDPIGSIKAKEGLGLGTAGLRSLCLLLCLLLCGNCRFSAYALALCNFDCGLTSGGTVCYEYAYSVSMCIYI